jgi:DNA-binding transcriptional ArsR family regulator
MFCANAAGTVRHPDMMQRNICNDFFAKLRSAIMADNLHGYDPELDVIPDLASLRVLAHPLRLKLLGELRRHGPATASGLGARLGESSGATSYHLRELAKAGFVVDEPGRGTTRERWWKSAHRSTYMGLPADGGADALPVGAAYMRLIARTYAEAMLHFTGSIETITEHYGEGWTDGFTLSDYQVEVTPAEAGQLINELHETILRHRRDEAPAGSRKVTVQFQVFPTRNPS